MLVRFSTRHGQLVMLGEPAVALLRLGGHSGTVPGAVLAADLPGFLSPVPPPPDPERREDAEPRERPISLRHRAVPLLEMLQTAIARESNLMWDKA